MAILPPFKQFKQERAPKRALYENNRVNDTGIIKNLGDIFGQTQALDFSGSLLLSLSLRAGVVEPMKFADEFRNHQNHLKTIVVISANSAIQAIE